ncbi:hypothetical protein [Streptomyces sp. NPDC002599]|uniref:hypothetical protein n=1 Tax=Streptomyces sp. NPDC002599 TaxID=3154421 RepID=UPI0033281204
MATGLVGRFTACGVLFLALAGCTSEGHGKAAGTPRPTASALSSASAAPTPVAGPARPVGVAARLGPKDSALAKWLNTADLPQGHPAPAQNTVVVIHRGQKGSGEVGWISGDSYCLGYYREDESGFTCGPYRVAHDPSVPTVGRMEGITDHMPSSDEPPQRHYRLAIVVDDPGPFHFTGDDHQGLLYQARATLEPNRTVTFLEWGYTGPSIPLRAKICSASTPRCITDHDY